MAGGKLRFRFSSRLCSCVSPSFAVCLCGGTVCVRVFILLCGKIKRRTGQNDQRSNEGSGEGKSLNYYNASLYRFAARFWYFDLSVCVYVPFFCVNVLLFYWKTRPTTRFMAIFVWEKRRMGAFAFRTIFCCVERSNFHCGAAASTRTKAITILSTRAGSSSYV